MDERTFETQSDVSMTEPLPAAEYAEEYALNDIGIALRLMRGEQ